MNTLSGFPTNDLAEIAKNGSIIPMRVSENGLPDEPLLEVLVCTAIGGKIENGMPHKIELLRVKYDGETTRESYQHEFPYIEKDVKAYKEAAEKLWKLVDEIDTVSDVIKPSDEKGYIDFYVTVMNFVEQRHKFLQSDGYLLSLSVS